MAALEGELAAGPSDAKRFALRKQMLALGAAHNVIAVQHRDGYDKHLLEAVRARRGWAIEAADGFCCSRVSIFRVSPPPRSVVLVRNEGRSEWRWAT